MYTEFLETTELDSRNRIRIALLSLTEELPYSQISVSQICHAAQVSRQAYYRLFDAKNDILILHLHKIWTEYFRSKIILDAQSTPELLQFFLFFSSYQDLLELLYKNNKMHLLQHILIRYSDRFIKEPIFRIPHGHDYATEFVASTLCSVLTVWAKMEFKTSCSVLATYVSQFLKYI